MNWYNWPERHPHLTKNSKTGIQGYFKTKAGKYIWLRSSWEYIYAKWLDAQNIKWGYELTTYKIDAESYRPDFFILDENDNISKIVEIKGSPYKSRLYKVDVFKKLYPDIDIIIIYNIMLFSKSTYVKELKEWKMVKLSKEELEKLLQ